MTRGAIPLDEAERLTNGGRRSTAAQRPTVDGSRRAWLHQASGLVDVSRWVGREPPEREWLVAGLVPMNAATLFSGDGELGKSTMALQLACSVILGRPWLGKEVRPGRAVVVSCEDAEPELWRRLIGIAHGEGFDLGAIVEELALFERVGRDSAVMAKGSGFNAAWEESPFWINFSNFVRDFGPSVVILDSLYDFFPGTGSQLDMATARLFMGMLRELANDANCAIVVLWHPSKSGLESGDGTSGNVAFRNAARSMLYVERADKDDRNGLRIISQKKNNYGPSQDTFGVIWNNGRFIREEEFSRRPDALAAIERNSVVHRAKDVFLSCLDAFAVQGRTVTDAKNSSRYAPKAFLVSPEAKGLKQEHLEKAMEALFTSGEIEMGDAGKYGNGTPMRGIRRTHPAEA